MLSGIIIAAVVVAVSVFMGYIFWLTDDARSEARRWKEFDYLFPLLMKCPTCDGKGRVDTKSTPEEVLKGRFLSRADCSHCDGKGYCDRPPQSPPGGPYRSVSNNTKGGT